MKKFVAFVPFLLGEEGHELSYHRAFHQAISDFNIPYELHFPKRAPPLEILPHWKKTLPKRSKFLSLSFCLRLILRRKKRIFFIEINNENHLKAIAYAAFFFAHKQDQVWVMIRDEWSRCHISEKKGLHYLQLLKKKTHLTLLTDSETFRPQFEKNTQGVVSLLPVLFLETLPVTPRRKKERLGCLFQGKPKKSKGPHLISKLLETEDPTSHFFELTFSFELPRTAENKENGLRLKNFDPGLPRKEYLEIFHENEIVLFPYSPVAYQNRTSGIFVEAVAFGKMPVVHKKTWLADELRRFDLAELIVEWENPSFFTHLKGLFENPEIWEKLKRMQQNYQEFHSIEGLKQQLLPLFERNP